MASDLQRQIVIVGGGIVGCTTAYYLCAHPAFAASKTKVTLIEASARGVAQGASGKAGGLVAKWAYPKELVNVSFAEHVRLAREHDGTRRWGWRFVGCGSWEGRGELAPDEGTGTGVGRGGDWRSLEKTNGLDGDGGWGARKRKEAGLPDDLDWVRADLTDGYSPMAPAGATAQVHPYLFTTSMLDLAKEKGCEFVQGKVTSIDIDKAEGRVSGVTYSAPTTDGSSSSTHTLPATHVILAAGAWSPRILPALPISGTRAHSVTIHPSPASPSRPTSSSPRSSSPPPAAKAHRPSAVPETVDDVAVDPAACESIRAHVASISPELRAGTVDKRQACFLPVVSAGGGPIVGEATNIAKGLVIATGHTCWGICNAPGTAKAISELIMEGKISCANLKRLEPDIWGHTVQRIQTGIEVIPHL
ncbi:FAD dependent oxidoreductase [Fomitopsis serialis]|uniref:FAD dependent oxidoreductase n=1 Tax=Fomitopsis serialis TaxID=139415 RepID=UPI002007B498|nr:FAD dependent oxidoreductase [Neoantrodia serialis]KAH9931531.1 FAD dependent oxidoreductase [Neoantrodia serialis]